MQARHRPVAGLSASRAGLGTVAAAVLLLVAVVLVRTPPDGPPPSPAPGPVTATTDPSPPADLAALPEELSRVAGARLGDPAAAVVPPLVVAPPAGQGGCRRLGDGGDDVLGWVVGDRVASVSLLRRGPDGVPLPLAAWLPDPLAGLVGAAGASAGATETVEPVRREDLPVLVRVVRLEVGDAELVLSDLGRPGGPRWAELRTPAGAGCAPAPGAGRRVGGPGPAAGPDRVADLVLGTPEEALVAAGLVGAPAPRSGPGCLVVEAGPAAGPGTSSLVLRDGLLAGYGLRAGSFRLDGSTPALVVGDPAGAVPAAFPGRVGPGGLRALLDNSGLVVRPPGARVVVQVARPSAVVDDVDVPVQGEPLVASLQVTRGC